MHSSPSPVASAAPSGQTGRLFWRNPSGAVGVARRAGVTEAAQRALLYRSEAFAEDLGQAYAVCAVVADRATPTSL